MRFFTPGRNENSFSIQSIPFYVTGNLKESHILEDAMKINTSVVKIGIKYFIDNIYFFMICNIN